MPRHRDVKYPFTEANGNGWRATVRIAGKRFKGETRADRKHAHEDAKALLSGPAPVVDSPTSLGVAVRRVLEECERRERRPATVEFYELHGNTLLEHFGPDRGLTHIGPAQVQAFIDARRAAGAAGNTIRHQLQTLKRALRLAGLMPNWLTLHVPRGDRRTETLGWDAAVVALEKLPRGRIRDALTLVLGTGIRRAELAREPHVTLDQFVIPVGKTGPRSLPVPPAGVSVARAALPIPGESERERTAWLQQETVRARALTAEPGLKLHDLRHAFASKISSKFSVPVVSALLGHALPGTTGLYVHADKKTLREAMESVWSALAPLTT